MIGITEAVDIIYKITVTDVQGLLDSNQVSEILRVKVREVLKTNLEYSNFVSLIKHLYKKAIEIPEKKEPQGFKDLEQTVDDIVLLMDFLYEVQEETIMWAVKMLKQGKWMTKTIQK